MQRAKSSSFSGSLSLGRLRITPDILSRYSIFRAKMLINDVWLINVLFLGNKPWTQGKWEGALLLTWSYCYNGRENSCKIVMRDGFWIEHEQLQGVLILLGSLEMNCFCRLMQGIIWLVINSFQHLSNWFFIFIFISNSETFLSKETAGATQLQHTNACKQLIAKTPESI